MAQVVNNWPSTAEGSVQSQASVCGICGEHIGTGSGFFPEYVFPLLFNLWSILTYLTQIIEKL
jgi:hypothetical protein